VRQDLKYLRINEPATLIYECKGAGNFLPDNVSGRPKGDRPDVIPEALKIWHSWTVAGELPDDVVFTVGIHSIRPRRRPRSTGCLA